MAADTEAELQEPEEDSSSSLLEGRGCTDFFCVIIFALAWVGFISTMLAGGLGGDAKKLYGPRDYRGQYCGVGENWNSDMDLESHPMLAYTMNTSYIIDGIAKQLVCSDPYEEYISELLTTEELDDYLCGCCKTPCASCVKVFDLGDVAEDESVDEIAAHVTAKVQEIVSANTDGGVSTLFSSSGENAGTFSSVFETASTSFYKVCLESCESTNYNGTNTRIYEYRPPPDVLWKAAWDKMGPAPSPSGNSGARRLFADTMAAFSFEALPESLCPYDEGHCVPMPGVSFVELGAGYCQYEVTESVMMSVTEAGASMGLNDLAADVQESIGSHLGDVLQALDAIAVVSVCCFVVALAYMVILRFMMRILVWVALISMPCVIMAGGAAAIVRSNQCSGMTFTDTGMSYSDYAQQATATRLSTINGDPMEIDMNKEVCGDDTCSDYRGKQFVTRSGTTCQHWNSQEPHAHTTLDQNNATNAGLEENYCRNPFGSVYIWCYTTDEAIRWELCTPIGHSPITGDCPDGYAVESDLGRNSLFVLGIACFVLAPLLVLIVCLLRSRIQLGIGLCEAGAVFIVRNPHIVLLPIIQTVVAVCWACTYAYLAAILLSKVSEDTPTEYYATWVEAAGTDSVPGKCTDRWPVGTVWRTAGDLNSHNDTCSGDQGNTSGIEPKCWACAPPRFTFDAKFAFTFFVFLWNNWTIVAIGQFMVASAVIGWCMTPKSKGSRPLRTALLLTFRYHIGSIMFGAFIIALVQFIRAVLYYFQKQAEMQKNKVMEMVLKVVQCCLWCFEKCLKFLTKHAYIIVATNGTNFCTSAKEAFKFIANNLLNLGVTSAFAALIQIIGKLFICVVTVALGYMILSCMDPQVNWFLPLVFIAAMAYTVSLVFMAVLDLAISTLLHCFVKVRSEGKNVDDLNFPSQLKGQLRPDESRKEGRE